MKLKLYYDDTCFAVVNDGEKIALNCANRKGTSDIVVETIADRSQLSTPTIYLDGSILTITDTSGVAESFIIYSNGSAVTSTTDTTVDLSTLITMDSGIRSITVVAVSLGYEDSEISEAVEYKLGVEISGTWFMNEDPSIYRNIVQNVKFTSGSSSYSKFETEFEPGAYSCIYYNTNTVYMNMGVSVAAEWYNESHRTVTFDGVQLVSQIFYNWFTTNAVQASN